MHEKEAATCDFSICIRSAKIEGMPCPFLRPSFYAFYTLNLKNSFQINTLKTCSHSSHLSPHLTSHTFKMASSPTLQLSAQASAAFNKCEEYNTDLAKWLVYTAESTSTSVKDFCYEAMRAYNDAHLHEPESEWDEMGFAKPANDSAENIQKVLDKHIAAVERALQSNESDPWNLNRLYPTGFVVIDRDDWRGKGVVVVHCDKDEEKDEWTAKQCRFKVKGLGFVLTTVLDGDDTFERVSEIYGSDSA